MFIEALPAVLVVHLKRFCFLADAGGTGGENVAMNGSVVKVGKQVQYGRELVVGPGMWSHEKSRYVNAELLL